jgi:hypothetical protein
MVFDLMVFDLMVFDLMVFEKARHEKEGRMAILGGGRSHDVG